jgi:2-oxoglutarate dehydrogenase E1 component
MTPKSLLRHKMSVSPVTDLSTGKFELIIPEVAAIDPENTTRIVFCSGKVYYDLFEAREVHGRHDVALIRIEQLYPFPIDEYAGELERYAHVKDVIWCQEEPQNQGAWYQIRHRLQEAMGDDQQLYYAGRPSAAAPASGIFKVHLQQQQTLLDAALGIESKASKTEKPREASRKKQ